MKIQMLPSTIDDCGRVSSRQHLMSIIIDDRVAIDAGSLAFSCTERQRQTVRDIVLTHTHLDHIAGLPLFIDDLFATLKEPIHVHATEEMIEILERDIFNWAVYPRFSELNNGNCKVVCYKRFEPGSSFNVQHLTVTSVPVNHKVSASGYIVSDAESAIGITGDTAETDEIWSLLNRTEKLKAVFVECAFPNELSELAAVSNHLTPQKLEQELSKLENDDCDVYIINIKPMYRQRVLDELVELDCRKLQVLEIAKVYDL